MRNVKIAIVSFWATVCVVWWHCSCGAPMERWFVPSFCTWAVPWFFFVSGFFFRNSFERRGGVDLLKSKIRSLLIPYLMWSMIGLLICGFKVGYGNFIEMFAASPYVFHPKGNPALWYVRTLMIFVLIGTPLMAFLKGWCKYAVIFWGGAFFNTGFCFSKSWCCFGAWK